ncbi:MAG: OmpA family protein [Dysgonomonas sp.]
MKKEKDKRKKVGVSDISFDSAYLLKVYKGSKNRFFVEGDNEVEFRVTGWYSETNPEEKEKVFWRYECGNSLYWENIGGESIKIIMPNSLCGSTTYTLSARLPGQKESKAKEIEILGFCKHKVTSHKWYIKDKDDGNQKTIIEEGQGIPLGLKIFLDLELEGLNGDEIVVEFYTRAGSIFGSVSLGSQNSKKIVDGKVTLGINTNDWKNKIKKSGRGWDDEEKVTIKVAKKGKEYDRSKDKEKDGIYIPDVSVRSPLPVLKKGLDEIGAVIYHQDIADSLSKAKIGENEADNIEYDQCTFEKISIQNEGNEFVLFEKGRTHRPTLSINRFYTRTPHILFDFDSYALDEAAKNRLKGIAEYLMKSNASASLQGHTDVRGTVEYNKSLAYNRVKAVEEYLRNAGVDPQNLSVVGFNKSLPIKEGENIPEKDHYANRRVKITFDVRETENDAPTYSIISTTEDHPKKFDIKINGYINKNCYHDDAEGHKPELKIEDETVAIKEEEDNTIPFEFCAEKFDMRYSTFLKVLEMGSHYKELEYDLENIVKTYRCHLHSCAYFSDTFKPTFLLKVYPDTVVTYNFRFDYDKDYFFNDLRVGLIKGNNSWNEWKDDADEFIANLSYQLGFLPGEKIGKLILELIYEYINDKIELFQYGIHWFQDFLQGNIPALSSDEGGKRRKWIESKIEFYVACMVTVELLLLIITRGRGIVAKLKTAKKFQKFTKMADWMSDNGLDVTMPKIAESSWVGYEQQDEGLISYIYRYKIRANPLFGINYSVKKISFNSTIRKKVYKPEEDEEFGELKKNILGSALKKALPADASFDFSVEGGFSFEYEVKYDYTRKQLTVIDRPTLKEYQDKTLFNLGGFVKMNLSFKAKATGEFGLPKIEWLPFIPSYEIVAKAEAKGDLSGGLLLQLRFHTHVLNPYYEWVLIFSGLKGKFQAGVEVKNNNEDDIIDKAKDQETKDKT